MDQPPLLVANWKAYPSATDALLFIGNLSTERSAFSGVELVICPPAPLIGLLHTELHPQPPNIFFGAQDVSAEVDPARTGEITASLLSAWCNYAIIGHSERRRYQAETDVTVQHKLQLALAAGLIPILCVGVAENDPSTANRILGQVDTALTGLSEDQIQKTIISYEPLWAVGAAEPASPEEVAPVLGLLRRNLPTGSRVIYGGAVDEETIVNFTDIGCDGVLVGRASLFVGSLLAMVQAVQQDATRRDSRGESSQS